ncbi:MAG: DUF3095 family protein [Balneolales bacterium]
MSEAVDQPVFWGSGVSFAENQIKSHRNLDDTELIEANFSGLECRWNILPSKKDEVAAYIIQGIGTTDYENACIYEECLGEIEKHYGNENDFHPIYERALQLTRKPQLLGVEWRLKVQPPTLWKKIRFASQLMFQYLTGVVWMRLKKSPSSLTGDIINRIMTSIRFSFFLLLY